MQKNIIIRELIIWAISLIIAYLVWLPIHSLIHYQFLWLGLISIVGMIQIFRWFVFYDKVIFFTRGRYIVLSIFALFAFGGLIWAKSQEIMLLSENQNVMDLIPNGISTPNLSMQSSYDLFAYLRNLLVLQGFGSPGLAFVLILKIIYRKVGFGNQKMKDYIKN